MTTALPTRHRAWTWCESGEPGTIMLQEKSIAVLGKQDILVANKAIGLNPVDWKIIDWGHKTWAKGHVPGVDGAGVVIAKGDDVTMPLGTKVAYHQSLTRDGSFAEHTVIDAKCALIIPEGLSFEIAASLPCPALTAFQAFDKIPYKANRDLLVIGAGGSVGLITAQLAIKAGYRVWVTASPLHRDTLLDLGVSGVFDYHHADWLTELQKTIGQRQLYGIIDTVSGEHASSLAQAVGFNGHLVCVQDRVEQNPLAPFTTAISLHEVALNSIFEYGSSQDWRDWTLSGGQLLQAIKSGELSIPTVETGQFDKLLERLSLLREGKRKAKQVIIF